MLSCADVARRSSRSMRPKSSSARPSDRASGSSASKGFLINDDGVYPALSRVADFSDVTDVQQSAALARELILGAWRTPPTLADQMSESATGRHMLSIVLDA
jgi:hypothetical protein